MFDLNTTTPYTLQPILLANAAGRFILKQEGGPLPKERKEPVQCQPQSVPKIIFPDSLSLDLPNVELAADVEGGYPEISTPIAEYSVWL